MKIDMFPADEVTAGRVIAWRPAADKTRQGHGHVGPHIAGDGIELSLRRPGHTWPHDVCYVPSCGGHMFPCLALC